MSTGLIFGLGVASAIVMILIIALVVVAFRLNKGLKEVKVHLASAEEISIELSRNIDSNRQELQRDIDSVSTDLIRKIVDARKESESYTDSRIDKILLRIGGAGVYNPESLQNLDVYKGLEKKV